MLVAADVTDAQHATITTLRTRLEAAGPPVDDLLDAGAPLFAGM